MDHGSSSSSSHTIIPKQFHQLNDSLFELYKPPGPASMQILFFHGFQRGDNKDAHLSTWQFGDGPCLCPQTWLVEEYPDAHIISVFYHGLKKNQEYGDMDMFKIGENLMADVLLEDIPGVCVAIEKSPENLQHLPKPVVGLEDVLREVKGKLQDATSLGLAGMGGLGKSTLAMAFNDLIHGPAYEYTCFIEDVKNIKDSIRDKMLQHIHRHGKKIATAGDELSFLRGKRLLLVLDDVALEKRDLAIVSVLQSTISVHKDSRFIATSRDSELLKIFDKVYTVPYLTKESSKQLFLTYAFKNEVPGPVSFAGYVDDIVGKCGGLPLTLEVVGKYLFDKREDIWEQALSALVAADSLCGFDENLWAKLKLSYDGLQKNEKDMFLDSATIFYGQSLKTTKEDFWSIGIKGFHIVWQHLLDLSLVWEVNSYGIVSIGMHEQLLSLGRKIASSPRENGRRVWEHDKALELLSTENYNEDDVKVIWETWV